MASKITDYPAKTTFNDGDLYDVSTFDGATTYTSEKMTFLELKTQLNSSLSFANLYNSDGTLTADRTLDGDSFSLTFDNLNSFNVNSTGVFDFSASTNISFNMFRQGVKLVEFNASSTFNASLTIGDTPLNANAQLNLGSGKGGLLMARLNAINLNLLVGEEGLMVYATQVTATFTSVGFWYYESGSWIKL